MPKTAINEYGDARWSKDDVSATAHSWQGRNINAVAQAGGMQQLADCNLRRGVPSALSLHPGTNARVAGIGCAHRVVTWRAPRRARAPISARHNDG